MAANAQSNIIWTHRKSIQITYHHNNIDDFFIEHISNRTTSEQISKNIQIDVLMVFIQLNLGYFGCLYILMFWCAYVSFIFHKIFFVYFFSQTSFYFNWRFLLFAFSLYAGADRKYCMNMCLMYVDILLCDIVNFCNLVFDCSLAIHIQ